MAKLNDILVKEKSRDKNNANVAYLYKEGNFWHAYEWSAWLLISSLCDAEGRFVDEKKRLKVSHKRLKSADKSYLMIGFPVSSLPKYMPESVTPELTSGETFEVSYSFDFGDMPLEDIQKTFDTWKEHIPIEEGKKQKEPEMNGDGLSRSSRNAGSLTGIMNQILSFPLVQKTPMECMQFIGSLKRQITELI